MAQTLLDATLDLGNLISGGYYNQIDTAFDILPGLQTPFYKWVQTGEARNVQEDMKFRWIRDKLLPETITCTEAMDASETDFSASAADVDAVQLGQILFHGTEAMRVTAKADATTLTVVRGYGATSGEAHEINATFRIGSPNQVDTTSFVQSSSTFGEYDDNYPMYIQYMHSEGLLRSSVVSYLTGGADEMDKQLQKLMITKIKQLEVQMLYGTAQQPSTTNPGSFAGVLEFLTSNVSTVDGLLGMTEVATMLQTLVNKDPQMGHTIWVSQIGKRILSGLIRQYYFNAISPAELGTGLIVDRVQLDQGTFDIQVAPQLNDSELLILRNDDIELVPIKHMYGSGWIEFERKMEQTDAPTREKGTFNVLSFKIGNEERHARIKGFTTDLEAYPNAI